MFIGPRRWRAAGIVSEAQVLSRASAASVRMRRARTLQHQRSITGY
jgi:hypothetical protein